MLEIADGALTGRMVDQPWGDICDGAEKKKMLLETCAALGIAPAQAIAVGDGANDLPMMSAAGLSVAYHAKPKVRAAANVAIDSGGLDRLLEAVRRRWRPAPAADAGARRSVAADDAPPDFLADRQRRGQPRRLDPEQLHDARTAVLGRPGDVEVGGGGAGARELRPHAACRPAAAHRRRRPGQ